MIIVLLNIRRGRVLIETAEESVDSLLNRRERKIFLIFVPWVQTLKSSA